jgi:opacity protein-like surface antigen
LRIKITALCLCLLWAAAGAADNIDYREANIEPGARSRALAGAFTAVSDDSSSAYSNPAGLSFIKKYEVSVSYLKWHLDTSIQNIEAAFSLSPGSTFCGAVMYNGMGEVENIDEAGYLTGETIRPYALMVSAAYGAKVFDYYSEGSTIPEVSLSLGAGLKYLGRDFDGYPEEPAVLLDAGGIFTLRSGVKIGLAIQNLGIHAQSTPPVNIKAGTAFKAYSNLMNALSLSADIKYCLDDTFTVSAGAEYSFAGNFFFRAGYAWESGRETEQGAVSGLSGGIGLNLMPVIIDYTVITAGGLGVNHVFSLKYRGM